MEGKLRTGDVIVIEAATTNTNHVPEAGRLLPTAEIISLAEIVQRRAEKFSALIGSLEAGISQRGEETARSLEAAGFSPEQQSAAARKAVTKARVEVMQNSADRRWELIRELHTAAESTKTTATLFASPAAVLARAGLGTSERTNLENQLTGSGRVELTNMAILAQATGNTVLGAALASVVEKMPRRDRPFSTNELAEKLVGEETRRVQTAIETIKNASQSAIVANRDFERGRASAVDRVKLALNSKEAA